MARRAAAAFALGGLLCASMAPAQAEGAVAIDGNHRIGADAIKSYFHTSDGGYFTDADLDAAVKAMYASGAFNDVTTAREGDALHVHVGENPLIARVAFEGNKKITEKQMTSLVQSRQGEPLSRPLLRSRRTSSRPSSNPARRIS